MKKLFKRIAIGFGIVCVLLTAFGIFLFYFLHAKAPQVNEALIEKLNRVEVEKGFYTIDNSWARKSNSGLYEVYVEGEAFERGLKLGKLTQELVVNQEDIFVHQIDSLVPSKFWQFFLHKFIGVFNRNLSDHIPAENLKEIYGVSRSASENYGYIGDKYNRILNYHAAHDIGHALQDLNMVGCTSFAVWDKNSKDSSLLVGRNFDFYVGDEFAKEKLVAFIKPDSGQTFAIVTWGGFTGCASGMNASGLSITINASKSDLPTEAATPISIVVREILQYATTIKEAIEIAKRSKVFVSESILVASAIDHNVVIIEKSPSNMDVYKATESKLICSNHFQSPYFDTTQVNKTNIAESSTMYRFERVSELFEEKNNILNYTDIAEILRNPFGKRNENLGMGNEMALNQLLAHHAVIFNNTKKLMWVSTAPFQLGKFVCYDLNQVFNSKNKKQNTEMYIDSLTIQDAPFLASVEYKNFLRYKELRNTINKGIKLDQKVNAEILNAFITSNSNYFDVYEKIGDYSIEVEKDKTVAKANYELALSKAIPTEAERNRIKKKLEKLSH